MLKDKDPAETTQVARAGASSSLLASEFLSMVVEKEAAESDGESAHVSGAHEPHIRPSARAAADTAAERDKKHQVIENFLAGLGWGEDDEKIVAHDKAEENELGLLVHASHAFKVPLSGAGHVPDHRTVPSFHLLEPLILPSHLGAV